MSNNVKIPSEIYSRVSGYYRPVNQWNRGKQEEFACRTLLDISIVTGSSSAAELQGAIS